MEMQPTDAENAAFVVFVVLVTRVILAFDLNLYIPLSKVDENMKRAHVRDAVHERKVRILRTNQSVAAFWCGRWKRQTTQPTNVVLTAPQ